MTDAILLPIEGFEDLAPSSEMEGGDTYFQAFNYAFANPTIKNIALTGPYCKIQSR